MMTKIPFKRLDVALIGLYFAIAFPLQLWSYWITPVPFMNYGSPALPNFPAYVIAAPLVAYLIWTGKPRARLATYVFVTFDILRSARQVHWLPLILDVAVIVYLQTPGMHHLYPSMWSRRDRWHLPARK